MRSVIKKQNKLRWLKIWQNRYFLIKENAKKDKESTKNAL